MVRGKVSSYEVIASGTATTLQGGDITISNKDGVKINEASVIVTNVEATNGVIHIIDSVLLHATTEKG